MIRKIVAVACLVLPLAAFAAEEKRPTPQQKPAADARAAQREKMKTCNKDAAAKNLKGDERKKFMSDCLKKKPAA
jgi:hypothetical protein